MKLFPRLIILLVIFSLIFSLSAHNIFASAKSNDIIEVEYQEPLFPQDILWYPGLVIKNQIKVFNYDKKAHLVTIKAVNTSQYGNLAKALTIEIDQGDLVDYGQNGSKTLQNFWDENEADLSLIDGEKSIVYTIIVSMSPSAGNEFQNTRASFDLQIGFKDRPEKVETSNTNLKQENITTESQIFPTSTPTFIFANDEQGQIVTSVTPIISSLPTKITIPIPSETKSNIALSENNVLGIQTEKESEKIAIYPLISIGIILLSLLMILL